MAGKLIDTIGMTPLVKLEHLAPQNGSVREGPRGPLHD